MLYSGLYEISMLIKEYSTALLIAIGFEIAIILFYLKELLDGYRRYKVVIRRVYIV